MQAFLAFPKLRRLFLKCLEMLGYCLGISETAGKRLETARKHLEAARKYVEAASRQPANISKLSQAWECLEVLESC